MSRWLRGVEYTSGVSSRRWCVWRLWHLTLARRKVPGFQFLADCRGTRASQFPMYTMSGSLLSAACASSSAFNSAHPGRLVSILAVQAGSRASGVVLVAIAGLVVFDICEGREGPLAESEVSTGLVSHQIGTRTAIAPRSSWRCVTACPHPWIKSYGARWPILLSSRREPRQQYKHTQNLGTRAHAGDQLRKTIRCA